MVLDLVRRNIVSKINDKMPGKKQTKLFGLPPCWANKNRYYDLQSPLSRWAASCPTTGSRWGGLCKPSCSPPRAQRSTTSTTTSSATRMKWVNFSDLLIKISVFLPVKRARQVALKCDPLTSKHSGFLRGWRGQLQFLPAFGLCRNRAGSDQGFSSQMLCIGSWLVR